MGWFGWVRVGWGGGMMGGWVVDGLVASDAPPPSSPCTRGSVSPVVVKRRCLRIAVGRQQAASKTSSL